MKKVRIASVLLGLGLVLGVANMNILAKQRTINNGRPVLLPLAPVDPRSLIQGDYMRLRYENEVFPDKEMAKDLPPKGAIILVVDEHNVGRFARLDDGGGLSDQEVRVRYRLRDAAGRMRLGAESFFFQEGDATLYQDAEYGVLHVGAQGATVLVGLADADHRLIERP